MSSTATAKEPPYRVVSRVDGYRVVGLFFATFHHGNEEAKVFARRANTIFAAGRASRDAKVEALVCAARAAMNELIYNDYPECEGGALTELRKALLPFKDTDHDCH